MPFHDFRQVYRAIYAALRFPDGAGTLAERWRAWTGGATSGWDPAELDARLPASMPHLFRATAVAMAQRTVPKERRKTRIRVGPRAFPSLLERALAGETLPLQMFRGVLRLRQIDFHDRAPLRLVGPEPYLEMARVLGELVRLMGYKGAVLLFDEAESIAAARITQRARAYALLDRFFRPERPAPGLFSVFAFTDDFFRRVEAEDYGAVQVRGEVEAPYFALDYARAWTELEVYRLGELSRGDWQQLVSKLARLHAEAYDWTPPEPRAQRELLERAEALAGHETRLKLKTLVDELDLLHQEQLFGLPAPTA